MPCPPDSCGPRWASELHASHNGVSSHAGEFRSLFPYSLAPPLTWACLAARTLPAHGFTTSSPVMGDAAGSRRAALRIHARADVHETGRTPWSQPIADGRRHADVGLYQRFCRRCRLLRQKMTAPRTAQFTPFVEFYQTTPRKYSTFGAVRRGDFGL